ncbi:MAG: putative Ig domain-containing protein [Myxococcota bacterium]
MRFLPFTGRIRAVWAALASSLGLALILAFWLGPATASAPTPITLGSAHTAAISTAGGSASFSFAVPAGQRVYVYPASQSSGKNLDWWVADGYGRQVVSHYGTGNLAAMGPVSLMGGDYELTVQALAGKTGTVNFELVAPNDSTTAITLGQVFTSELTERGEIDTFTLELAAPTRIAIDRQTASAANSINALLTDGLGNVRHGLTTSFNDIGPYEFPAGTVTFELRSELGKTSTYSFAVVEAPVTTSTTTVDTSTTTAVSVGEQVDVALSIPTDGSYSLEVISGTTTNAVNWTLAAANGNVIFPWTPSAADRAREGLMAGDYTLSIRAEPNTNGGSVTWRMNTVTDTTQAITVGTPVTSALTMPGQRKDHTFSVAAGDVLSIDVTGGTSTNFLAWELKDSLSRDYIFSSTAANDVRNLKFATAGTHTLTLKGDNGQIGSVNFTLVPKTLVTGTLTLGGTTSGTIDAMGKEYHYTLTVPTGQVVDLLTTNLTNSTGMNFRVIDSEGREIVKQTASLATIQDLALMGGTYTVIVMPEGNGSSGAFTLEVVDEGLSTYTAPSGTAVTLGTEVSGNVSAGGGPDHHSLTLASPTTVYVDLLQGEKDLNWELVDPAGQAVFSSDARYTGTNDHGPLPLAAGTYTLSMTDPTNGQPAYRFKVHDTAPVAATAIALEQTVANPTLLPGFRHEYTLTLATATNVFLEHIQGDNKVRWQLMDSAGQDVQAAGAMYASGLGPWHLQPDTYTLKVYATYDNVPAYQFRFREVFDETLLATMGTEVTGIVQSPGSAVTYTLQIPTDVPRAVLDYRDGNAQLRWNLYDPVGRSVFGNQQVNADRGPFALHAGTYELVIDPNGDYVYDWTFELLTAPEGGATAALGQRIDHTYGTPQEAFTWTIPLAEEQKVYFDAQQATSAGQAVSITHEPTGWTLFDFTNVNATNDDSGPWTVPAGSLVVRTQNRHTSGASLGFVVQDVVDADRGEVRLGFVEDVRIVTPGGTVRYTLDVTTPGEMYTFDILRAMTTRSEWTLRDPVGAPVFLNQWLRYSTDDEGPFSLATGTYELVFDPPSHNAPPSWFKVRGPTPPSTPVVGCANCDELDVVFVFDTSISMNNEAQQMCDLTDDLIAELRNEGITVTYQHWGISDLNYIPCATSTVIGELGAQVPGGPPPDLAAIGTCIGGGTAGIAEDWALATAVVAERYPWREGAVRLVVPIGDEGPYCGSGLTLQDDDAIVWAAQIAKLAGVVVSPIQTEAELDEATLALGELMAQETAGTHTPATFVPGEMLAVVADVATKACDTQQVAVEPYIDGIFPASGATLPTGTPIMISGHVLPANTVRPVVGVTIDGLPVEVYDGAGAFFTEVTLQPGTNTFTLGLQQSCGEYAIEVSYEGGDPAGGGPLAGYFDVTSRIDDVFSLTAFPRDNQRLLGKVAAYNKAADLPGPLLFVVGNDLDSSVTPLNTAGTLPTGEAYYEILPAGQTLAMGGTTSAGDLTFANPNQTNVQFTRRWLAPSNVPPYFTSAPPTQVLPGGTYTYLPTASDPNGQPVSFDLEMAPAGMTLTSGTISWTPGAGVEGSFDVSVRASDGAGGIADQRYVVTVGPASPNRPPLFTTAPLTQINSGSDYAYDANAWDADGDTVTYTLAAAPSGMTVNASGEVRWTGPADGSYVVGLQASDGNGAVANQAFTLTVGAPTGDTSAPRITSLPNLIAVVDTEYEYAATADDADLDPLTWSLTTAPTGMTVDSATGLVTFTPTAAQVGAQTVTLVVSDGQGGQAEQSYSLDVRATAPNGTPYFVSTPVRDVEPNDSYTYPVKVVDPELEALTYSLPTAPSGMLISTQGVITWTAPATASAPFDVLVRATDPQGAVAEQAYAITLQGSLPPAGGVAFFDVTSPSEGSRVAVPTPIVASVDINDGATVASWEVTGIASGTGPFPAELGTLDPTLLDNGLHEVEIKIIDTFGRAGSTTVAVEVAGQMKLGSYDVAFLDATWKNSAMSLPLTRRYTTLRKDEVGDFGYGWEFATDGPTISINGPLGEGGWYQESCGSGSIFVPICTKSIKPHIAVVRWPDGRQEAFELEPTPGSSFFAAAVPVAWKQRPGAYSSLRPTSLDTTALYGGAGNLLGGIGGGGLYNPTQFWLTDPSGVEYLLDVNAGMKEMVLPPSNRIEFRTDGIYPESGTATTWVRDGHGRITSMTLPSNETFTYAYDSAGDLVSVTDSDGDMTRFVYDSAHRLMSYNVDGRPPVAQIVYGPDGRVESITDAQGVLTTESSNSTAYTHVVTGPDPGLTQTTEYDSDGMMVKRTYSYVDPDGAPQNLVEEWTYDQNYYRATHTLTTGAVESWQHDEQGRQIQHVDSAGVVREWDYGPFGQLMARREDGDVVETTTFDAAGLPFEVRRGDGTLARRMTYTSRGLPLTVENGAGQVLTLDYGSDLQLDSIQIPDYAGSSDIINVTHDARGQLTSHTRSFTGGVGTTSITYDANGNRKTITNPLNHVMTFTYDEFDRPTTYTDKLGRTVTWTYDENGRELTRTNRNGEVVTRTYDAAGRLATVQGPGVDKQYQYDALGRVVLSRSGDHTETRKYSGAKLIEVTVSGTPGSGHVGHTWTIGMDNADRIETLTGESQSVTHGYDSRGRLSTVTEASLGTYSIGYDIAGRRSSLTRPNGVTTTTSFNASGQAESVITTDLIGATLHQVLNTYNGRGQPDTTTDSAGTHTYSYDIAGRLTFVDHPAAAAFSDESYTYDTAGRRTSSHRDPVSDVIYDAADKLLQDATYTYLYDLEGRRISRTHRITSAITTYSYNALDQLVSLDEGGVSWTFSYDANDLRVQVQNDAGYGEAFVYDLNGLARATYDLTGTRTAGFLTSDRMGDVLAKLDGGLHEDAVRDHLGTTVGWLNGTTGQVAGLVSRDAFGVRAALPSAVVPYGYTGHAEDPTGMVWARARCMAPSTGTWNSEDPAYHEPRYLYARGAPTYLYDPTGTETAISYNKQAVMGCAMGFYVGQFTGAVMVASIRWAADRNRGTLTIGDFLTWQGLALAQCLLGSKVAVHFAKNEVKEAWWLIGGAVSAGLIKLGNDQNK